jgi:3-hydroxybutyryl-CoA dehydrogenase
MFVVMHFWNPAHLMPLVEVLGCARTDDAVIEEACAISWRIGKKGVRLQRSVAGFVGTRLQQAVVREAISLLASGVATAEDIDAAVRLSFGARFPVLGPLETTDLGGLDVVLAIHRYLLPDLDVSPEPHPYLEELVEKGRLGVKSGRGFYDWTDRNPAALRAARDEELVRRLRLLQQQGALRRLVDGGSAQ